MRRTTGIIVVLLTLCCHLGLAQEPLERIMSDYQITGCRYWFDNATEVTQTNYQSGQLAINVAALEEGFHTLHYQVVDDKGGVSPARTMPFFRIPSEDEKFKDYTIQKVRYWFDKDYTPREVAYVSGTSTIDVSALEEGFHTLHYQVIDSKGESSPSRTSSFFRVQSVDEQFKDYVIQKVRYWFDKDYTPHEVAYVSSTSAIDVSALEEGFHTLHYQVIDSKGESSPSRTKPFFRIPSADEVFKDYTIAKVRYWFDKDYTPREVAYVSGTSAIDVSALEEGFHALHYQVIDSKGESSPSRTKPFFRIQPTEESFKDYTVKTLQYWYDNDVSTMQTAEYTGGATVLDLSSLPEGAHTLSYQVLSDDGQASPAVSASVDRWLYDIYVSQWTEYGDSLVTHDPLFATRPDLKLYYLPDDTNVRGHLSVDEGTMLSLGKYVQTANWGTQHDNNMFARGGEDYYHLTTLLNSGHMRADSVMVKQRLYRDRWHFLSLPFNVNLSDIGVPDNTYYVLRAYDGEARARGEMTETWQNLGKGEQMEAGKGYIVQLTRESSDKTAELTFKAINDPKKNDIFATTDVVTVLEEHEAEFAHNRSWNLVGNPYPSFYDSRFIDQDGIIIVWNGNGYTAYSLADDSYILMPFEAFFIQKPLKTDALMFASEGRQHTHEVQPRATSPRRAAKAGQNRRVLNFTLADGADTDRSRVVINEQASMGYETDKDAPKFMESKPQKPQLFSVESGVQYAINERPMGDGLVAFTLFIPADGEYHFSVEGDADNMVVMDAETGTVWALADGEYVFKATEGMHHARLVVSLTGEATAIAQIDAYDDGEIKVVDGLLSFDFMQTKHIKVFSLDGRLIFNEAASHANVKVAHGVYLINIDGKTTKVIVK